MPRGYLSVLTGLELALTLVTSSSIPSASINFAGNLVAIEGAQRVLRSIADRYAGLIFRVSARVLGEML